ncbi:ArsB/NhaD family transporter [Oceanobacillus rekensis]|uniref:ArsB/NhaD family transporter n=1 Tax=Oceanobacillus rekensis TaxID=937927 RepID=UPI000B4337C0|nr:ArsB/NhaD family transporter [Oceanobacillus rekensis]
MDVILAGIIFVVSYFFIMTEKINRAIAALSGGILLLLTGIYSTQEVFFQYIDWNTIALLFAMMVLISITEKTGLFTFIAIRFAQKVRGNPMYLLIGSAILTAIGSAFLDNVTTVLIFVPVILKITRLLNLPAFPYLLTIIFSSNIGGAATLIGDPPNIMIGQAVEHFTFLSFIQHTAPVAVIMFTILITFTVIIFNGSLSKIKPNIEELSAIDASKTITKSPLLYKSVTVLLMTLTGFLLHSMLNIEMTTIALTGAILLLLLTESDLNTEEILSKVEWVTLFFFIGLFAIVGGLQQVGVIDEMARMIVVSTEGDYVKTTLLILWVSGLFSGFIDNIPFVAAMIPVIHEFESYGMVYLDPIWWALAIGACMGGNLTLVGASANVVVAGMAEADNQKISFIRFMKYGIPIVLISLVVSTIYIYIRYLIPYMGQG